MDDKVVSDILPSCHGQPIASSWMQGNKIGEIIEFVVEDPVLGSIAAPEFSVPGLLFLQPDCSVALKPAGWKPLPVLLWLNYLHIQLYHPQTTRITKGQNRQISPLTEWLACCLFCSLQLSTEPIMNQKTLQNIYKTFETEEFYRRYLLDLGCREDRRSIEEQRKMRVTSRNNSVVLSCGQTIIIAHVEAAIEQVTFSPVSNSYGEPLLKLKVNNANNSTQKYRENKADKAVEQYVLSKTEWGIVEDQLSGSDLVTGKQYAYKGQIVVRILGDDGGVEEFSLLAVQLLLLTCKFRKFTVSKEKIEFKEDFSLIIKSFIYPIKYCQILGKVLVDPSLSEQHNSDLVVTVLKDLRQPEKAPTVIQRAKKSASIISEQNLLSIMKRWQGDLAQVLSTFDQKVSSLESTSQCILN